MTSLFRIKWPVFLFVYYLLASAATTPSRQERKNRYRRTTMTSTSDLTSSASELATPTSKASTSGHSAPDAPWALESEDKSRQSSDTKVTRKSGPHSSKFRKNSTSSEVRMTAEHAHWPKSRTSAVAHERMATHLTNVSPVTGPGVSGHRQKSAEVVTTRSTETVAVNGHHRNPRVRTASTTAADTTTQTTTSPSTAVVSAYPTRKPLVTAKVNRTAAKSGSGEEDAVCNSSCDTSRCRQVEAETCRGRVVKDHCNCCPVCLPESGTIYSKGDIRVRTTTYHPSNACDGMVCTKNKVCILNIQGIPMCRCPNIYSCRNGERNPICGLNGITYKNKCFLKADECTMSRRIRVSHKGACRSPRVTNDASSAASAQNSLRKAEPFDVPTYSDMRTIGATERKAVKGYKKPANLWKDPNGREEMKTVGHKLRNRNGNRRYA